MNRSYLTTWKLSDLYKMSSGISTKPSQAGHGHPFLSFKDVFKNYFLPEELESLMNTSIKEQEIYSIKEGDIFLTRTSETLDELGMSSVAINDYDFTTFSGFLKRLRPKDKDKVYHKYMAFYLRSTLFRVAMNNNAIMTLRASFNEQIFSYLDIVLPSFENQKRIGDFLFYLHQKTELNKKINTELENIAKTLYDYWFVQFDFPNEHSKPYKSSGGKMVYDKVLKRELPEGWRVKTLKEHASIKKGTLITEKLANTNGDIKVVSAGLDFSYYHSEANYLENTITVSASGASAGYVNFWREPIFACDCTTVRGKNLAETYHILEFLKLMQFHIYKQARGSAQPHVYPKDIEILNIGVPDEDLLKKYGSIIEPINQKISNNLRQNQELAQLRDWLLPMLMNGQIKVGDDYNIDNSEILVAAGPDIYYSGIEQLDIPSNRKGFARQVLAGKVVSVFKDDPNFSNIKFQKVQFLAEHIIEADLNQNYYYQAAGPYDNAFMKSIYGHFKTQKWFDSQNQRFVPLTKEEKIEGYHQGYFAPAQERLYRLFNLLYQTTEAEAEIIATIYAVWNNRIIEGTSISDSELIEDFYKWSDRKQQYTNEQIMVGLKWLRDNNFEPKGFGKLIKKSKSK